MTETEYPSTFENPYRLVDKDDNARINQRIDKLDHEFIMKVGLQHGSLSTAVGILFKKLVHELQQRKITQPEQREQFQHFVAQCRLVLPGEVAAANGGVAKKSNLPRRPAGGTAVKADGQDDTRRKARTDSGSPPTPNEPVVVQRESGEEEG